MRFKKVSGFIAAVIFATATIPASAAENNEPAENIGGLTENPSESDGGLVEKPGGEPDIPEVEEPEHEIWTDSQGNKWVGTFNTHDFESKYEITVNNVIIHGTEKTAVKISGLSSKMLDTKYERDNYKVNYDDGGYSICRRYPFGLAVTIDIGERCFCFSADDAGSDFTGTVLRIEPSWKEGSRSNYRVDYLYAAAYPKYDDEVVKYFDTELKRHGDTFELIGYLDTDDEAVKELVSTEETTVAAFAGLYHEYTENYDANGVLIPSEGGLVGVYPFYMEFTSDKKVTCVDCNPPRDDNLSIDDLLYGIDYDECRAEQPAENGSVIGGDVYKEIVKVKNNLNIPAEGTWTDSQGNKWVGTFNTHDFESKYEITADKVTINGAEKAAVKISGLSSKMLDTKYERNNYKYEHVYDDGYTLCQRGLSWLGVTIDIGERCFYFAADNAGGDFKGAVLRIVPNWINEYGWSYYRGSYLYAAGEICFDATKLSDSLSDDYKQQLIKETQEYLEKADARFFDAELKRNGDTFELIGYFDADDEAVKELMSAKETTAAAYAFVVEHGGEYGADGTPLPAGGANPFYLEFTSDNKVIAIGEIGSEFSDSVFADRLLYGIDHDEERQSAEYCDIYKEIVKIKNNLNIPSENPSNPDNTSKPDMNEPTTSTPSTSEPGTSAPSTSEPSTSETSDKEFKPVLPETGLDAETERVLGGITVTALAAAFDDGVIMNVKPVPSESGFSFDITFTKDGKEVQPVGSVIVKLPVPEALKGKNIYVFHVENGNYVLINSEVKDGFVVFAAEHFSEYVLSSENLAEKESPVSTNTPEDKPTESSNPSTGAAVAAAPLLLAAGAAVVIVTKKKR